MTDENPRRHTTDPDTLPYDEHLAAVGPTRAFSQRLNPALCNWELSDDDSAAMLQLEHFLHGLLVAAAIHPEEMDRLRREASNPATLVGKRARQIHQLLGDVLQAERPPNRPGKSVELDPRP